MTCDLESTKQQTSSGGNSLKRLDLDLKVPVKRNVQMFLDGKKKRKKKKPPSPIESWSSVSVTG